MLSVAVEDHQLEWLGGGPDVLTAEETRRQVESPILLGATWERGSTALVHPARLACCGATAGPSLYHLMAILGKERVLQRLDKAMERM